MSRNWHSRRHSSRSSNRSARPSSPYAWGSPCRNGGPPHPCETFTKFTSHSQGRDSYNQVETGFHQSELKPVRIQVTVSFPQIFPTAGLLHSQLAGTSDGGLTVFFKEENGVAAWW